MAFAVGFASACGRKPVTAAASAPLLRPDPWSRVRWPSKPPFRERSWRSMNRRFGAVGLRDQDLPALFKSSNSNGSERSRLPVAAKIAFETAGAMGRTPGSPRRLVRFSDMNVHGRHIRQAQWFKSIEIGLCQMALNRFFLTLCDSIRARNRATPALPAMATCRRTIAVRTPRGLQPRGGDHPPFVHALGAQDLHARSPKSISILLSCNIGAVCILPVKPDPAHTD